MPNEPSHECNGCPLFLALPLWGHDLIFSFPAPGVLDRGWFPRPWACRHTLDQFLG